MMSLEILMIKISLLTEKANVTKMQPKKVRQLWRIIFRTEKQKKWVSLNISLIFLPAWTDYHLNHLSYYSKESTFEVKIALSLQEAMDIIKQLEIENTVRFSIYSSTKEFGSTGKRFHYKVSIIYFNKRILICQSILYRWYFQLQNYRYIVLGQCSDSFTDIRSVDTTQYISCHILNNKSTVYIPEYKNMSTLLSLTKRPSHYHVLPNLISMPCIYNDSLTLTENVPFFGCFQS